MPATFPPRLQVILPASDSLTDRAYVYTAYDFGADMRLAAGLFALLVSGCAVNPHPDGTFAQGRLISQSEAKVVVLQVDGSGRISGVDTTTIEAFHGTYTAVKDASGRVSAVLTGNKGTVFNINMKIRNGGLPSGAGEATDNAGKKYNVEF